MAIPTSESDSDRPLDVLGIGADEERVYCMLLARGAATVEDVARESGLSPRASQRLLDTLEGKGLATHSPERPRRYIPAPPEFAVEALVNRRQARLERARAAITALRKHAARAPGASEREQIVELITSREAESQIFEQMQHVAQREMLTLVRPPLRISRLDIPFAKDQHHQLEARRRGVRYRSIIDAEYLSLPGAGTHAREDVRAGEEIRVFPALPFKLVLADRRIALIPLNLQQPDSPSLLVRSSALLDALHVLFESLWERSTPIAFTRSGELKNGRPGSRLSREAADLIPLLASGLNDKAIAHELSLSPSTLNRRIAGLMKGLDTRSRFQLGWRAALNAFPRGIGRTRKPG